MGKYSQHVVIVDDAWDSGEIHNIVGPFRGLKEAQEWIDVQEKHDRGMRFYPWEIETEQGTWMSQQPHMVGELIAQELPVLAGKIVSGSFPDPQHVVAHTYLGSPNGKKCEEFIRSTKRYIAKLGDVNQCFDFYANLMNKLQDICKRRG